MTDGSPQTVTRNRTLTDDIVLRHAITSLKDVARRPRLMSGNLYYRVHAEFKTNLITPQYSLIISLLSVLVGTPHLLHNNIRHASENS